MTEPSTSKSRKRKKPLFTDLAKEFEELLLASVLPNIKSSGAKHVAVGIDMAAQEGNWGVSIITTDSDFCRGSLRLLLPHRFDLAGFQKKHPIKPSGAFIAEFLSGLANQGVTVAVAVDVPFGWPLEHSSFLESWSALPVPSKAISPPARACFEYRLCDRALMGVLKSEGRFANVLAVGADKIASAAFEWATQRLALNAHGQIDVGYDLSVGSGGVFFETYPSAFVRLNYPKYAGYKTLKETTTDKIAENELAEEQARQGLLAAIKREYDIDTTHCDSNLQAACLTSASDAFDGFLSAIAAWDYLKWRFQKTCAIRMSSPGELLGSQRAAKEKARIEKEGWFLTRLPASIAYLHDEMEGPKG